MIEVKYWPRELRLTVKGHAVNENMEGNPDVCAGASMLVYSLMNAMDGFNAAKWCKAVYFEGNGEAYIRMMKPKWHKFKALRVAMGMTYGGLGMLAQQYPKLVKVKVCTGEPFNDLAVIADVLEKTGEKKD